MNVTEVSLRKCPFCGNEPKLRVMRFGVERMPRYGVVCESCKICLGWEFDMNDAVNKWNHRYAEGLNDTAVSDKPD